MKIAEVGREVLYPVTDLAVLLALVTFALLFKLADAAGVFGIWLTIVIFPAFFRYSLYLLEARARGDHAPVPGIEDFSLVDNFWALFPTVLLGAFIWLEWSIIVNYSALHAAWALLAFIFVYPASLAVLSLTRSPLASINPLDLWHLVRLCGRDYLWIPVTVVPVTVAVIWLATVDLPFLVFDLVSNYAFILLFTMTGAVMHAHDAMQEVDIELPLEPTESELQADLQVARSRVANHAYGFISRGNRAGGFAHIRQRLEEETERGAAYAWFFREMLKWEDKVPALFFAQDYLRQLLGWNLDREALKLISRCLHENADWLPGQAERGAVRALIERHGRDDLARRMPGL